MNSSINNDDMSTSIEDLLQSVPADSEPGASGRGVDVIQDKDLTRPAARDTVNNKLTSGDTANDVDSEKHLLDAVPGYRYHPDEQNNLIRDAIIVMCLFWVFSSPFLYQQVNNLVNVIQPNGVPAPQGLLLHGTISGLCYYIIQKFLL